MERYGSVLECMDGRSQRKVADYLNTVFGVRNLDTITTAGAIRHLAEDTDQTQTLLQISQSRWTSTARTRSR